MDNIKFFSKSTNVEVSLVQIDEEICTEFDAIPHDENWYYDWWRVIAYPLAQKQTFDDVEEAIRASDKEDFTKHELVAILCYIERHYVVHSN